MSYIIRIDDDFDLQKIAVSGQIFRARPLDAAGGYRFIHGSHVLNIAPAGAGGQFEVSCDAQTWERIWVPYFDLSRNYADLRLRARGKSDFVDTAMDFGAGLRVLAQDPWEMLVTFIISQRKSMPAIASAVDALCERFGEPLIFGEGEGVTDVACAANASPSPSPSPQKAALRAFPTAQALALAGEDALRGCSLGYRAPYVLDAARRVAGGELDLNAAAAMEDARLFEYLQTVHGVGKKVANCVCLFGFGRTSLVPVDVWIARAIDRHCDGCDPFAQFGQDAGVIQQYVFFYMTQTRPK